MTLSLVASLRLKSSRTALPPLTAGIVRVEYDKNSDPRWNLDREEALFRLADKNEIPDLVRFWVNGPCLIRGKVRSPKYGWYAEERARSLGIPVYQRSTGGGVVYHDEGNLNWSFFLKSHGAFLSPVKMFSYASSFMIGALGRIGLDARFSPPNRIDSHGRKISGMAARSTPRAYLVHGTLLLHADLGRLNELCVPPLGCPPVANVQEWLPGVEAPRVIGATIRVLSDSGFEIQNGEGLRGA